MSRETRALGIAEEPPPAKRMTVEAMLALGDKMAALPLRDPRSAQGVTDDLNEP